MLAAAARFWAAFPPAARPEAAEGEGLRLAFVVDAMDGVAGVALRQDAGGVVRGQLVGDADPDAVRRQVARVLSLDHDAAGYAALGERDPVLGALQRARPGLRPVLWPSPYEAAAWAILSARSGLRQTLAVRRRLQEQHGVAVQVDGERLLSFPLPERLLALHAVDGLPEERLRRLHAVAEAALDGRLDAAALREAAPVQALERLRTIRGIGPFSAGLVLARASGAADVLPSGEPRVRAAAARAYGLAEARDEEAFAALAERWRPFRTWACVLLRSAGEDAPATARSAAPRASR